MSKIKNQYIEINSVNPKEKIVIQVFHEIVHN